MWFSATALFRHTRRNRAFVSQYEERVVVVRAPTEAKAEELFLAEFAEYAPPGGPVRFLGEYSIQPLSEPPGSTVVEVGSMLRVTPIAPKEYLARYWGTLRPASCDTVGWTHVWYNKDDTLSACYNCLEERPGALWRRPRSPRRKPRGA